MSTPHRRSTPARIWTMQRESGPRERTGREPGASAAPPRCSRPHRLQPSDLSLLLLIVSPTGAVAPVHRGTTGRPAERPGCLGRRPGRPTPPCSRFAGRFASCSASVALGRTTQRNPDRPAATMCNSSPSVPRTWPSSIRTHLGFLGLFLFSNPSSPALFPELLRVLRRAESPFRDSVPHVLGGHTPEGKYGGPQGKTSA
jgi:hypothetical protein